MPAKSDKQQMMMAYIAGLFDGEGHTTIYLNHKNTFRLWTGITNKDKIVLTWLQSLYGGCIWEKSRKSIKHSIAYEWRLTKKYEMNKFLNDIFPFVRIKSKQIRLAIDFLELPLIKKELIAVRGKTWPLFKANNNDIIKREVMKSEMNNLNRRGNLCLQQ